MNTPMWGRRVMVSWAASGGALPAGGRRQLPLSAGEATPKSINI